MMMEIENQSTVDEELPFECVSQCEDGDGGKVKYVSAKSSIEWEWSFENGN